MGLKHIIITSDLSEESTVACSAVRTQMACFPDETVKISLVYVLHEVIANPRYQFDKTQPYLSLDELEIKATEALKTIAIEHLGELPVETIVLRSSIPIPQKIIDYAEDVAANLVIMASHGLSGFQLFVLGSVTEKVARGIRCPLLIVPVSAKAKRCE